MFSEKKPWFLIERSIRAGCQLAASFGAIMLGELGEVTRCPPFENCLRLLETDGLFLFSLEKGRVWVLLLLHAQAQPFLAILSSGVRLCFCLLILYLSVKKWEATGSGRFY